MKSFITYPHPPAAAEQTVPKFELFINYETYTWECVILDSCDDYDGTFSIDHFTEKVHIDWYQIPPSNEFWEEVESQLRSLIAKR